MSVCSLRLLYPGMITQTVGGFLCPDAVCVYLYVNIVLHREVDMMLCACIFM